MKEFENRKNIFWSDNDDVVTSLNDNVDYVELAVKERTKTKNLKAKKKYFILQERNRQFLKSIKNDEIETSSTRRRKITKTDKNLLTKISKLKRQRSTINLKSTNFDIYNDKSFKKFKNWTHNAFNVFEISFFYFFSKWIKINWAQQFIRDTSSQRWNNKKKKFEDYSENVTMKEFLEFFDQFDEEFAESSSRHYIKTWCDKTKSIIKRKRLRCLCWSFRNWFWRIHFDSAKKSSFQSIKKKNKRKI